MLVGMAIGYLATALTPLVGLTIPTVDRWIVDSVAQNIVPGFSNVKLCLSIVVAALVAGAFGTKLRSVCAWAERALRQTLWLLPTSVGFLGGYDIARLPTPVGIDTVLFGATLIMLASITVMSMTIALAGLHGAVAGVRRDKYRS